MGLFMERNKTLMEIAGLQGQARAVRNPNTAEAYHNFSYTRQMNFNEERRKVNQRAEQRNRERQQQERQMRGEYGDYGDEGDGGDHDMVDEHDGQ